MFKNAIFYRVEPGFKITDEILSKARAVACGPFDESTAGFAAPRPDAPDLFVHTVGEYSLIVLEIEQRILPSAVIKEFVAEKIKAILENEGRTVGRKEKRDIEEATRIELLPKSFTRKKRVYAAFAGGLLLIDGTRSQAELLIETLNRANEGESVLSLHRTLRASASAMTEWLSGEEPAGMTLDAFCQLSKAEGESITYRTALDGNDIRERIATGYIANRVGVTIGERSSLIVTENFEIKRFTLLDVIVEQAQQDVENEAERFDTDLTLYIGELLLAIDFLTDAFGGVVQDLVDQGSEVAANTPSGDGSSNDPLYEQAETIVVTHQRASISLVQRHLRIGYNRAARLLETMESTGIISPQDSAGNRQVLKEAA